MGIEHDISAALAERAAQRDFIDGMTEDWRHLAGCLSELTAVAVVVGRGAAAVQTSDSEQRASFGGAAGYLAENASWPQRARAVQARLDTCDAHVNILRRRIYRETVNIGVIGITRAGKSTLLRRISGLGEEQIPSNEYSSTTAAPCRIFHEYGSGAGHARLTLHTWDTFREAVLVPLHDSAQIASAPLTLSEFRRFPYPQPSAGIPTGQAGTERYRERLRIAQASLPSYEGLLAGGGKEITLGELRPYVAYPADDDPRPLNRPYHAVQAIDVFCPFEDVGAVKLGLVDLPGSAEAGLDVHGRFLRDMRNDVDVLFIVKRPEKATVQVMDPDWEVMQLADEAAGGVHRDDFIHYIVNQDSSIPPDFLARAWAAAREAAERLGFDVLRCDIKQSPDVTGEVLEPVLRHLAKRLADMDRDAIQQVLTELREVAADIRALAEELAREAGKWLAGLPNEQEAFRIRARELKNKVSVDLDAVLRKYDDLAKQGKPIPELDREIQIAVEEMHRWVDEGLDAGSPDLWLQRFGEAVSGREPGRELDRQYNSARSQVSRVFGRIDESLASSVDILWGEIATAMRLKLTEHVIPAGSDSHAVLTEFAALASARRLKRLSDATDRLLALPTEYGNIFLRVGRPVVREISWYQASGSTSSLSAAAVGGAVGGLVGLAVGGVAGHAVGAAAGHAIGSMAGGAASSTVREGIKQASGPASTWWNAPSGSGQPQAGQPQDGYHPQAGPGPAGPPSAAQTQQQAAPQPQRAQRQGPSAEARAKYPMAAEAWDRLVDIIERVTVKLEDKFRAEAQQTVQVLAAATDVFIFSATGTPDVEVEFEKLCEPIQRELWPDAFSQSTAKVAADLAVLQSKAAETQDAADPILVSASRGRLLTRT
jgi:hypothetical protein